MKCENKTPGAHVSPPKVCNKICKFELRRRKNNCLVKLFKLGARRPQASARLVS